MAGNEKFESLQKGSTDTAVIGHYYDDWAKDYDLNIRAWGYRAPEHAAAQLAPYLRDNSKVLDVGCGTGLVADAIIKLCDCSITGIDISEASLGLAERRDRYTLLRRCDLQQPPLPFEDNAFDAAISIGVMTYIADPVTLLSDLCRVVQTDGHVLFTHRDDRWQEQKFDDLVFELESRGLWEIINISEPCAYLPGNVDFADNIKAIFALSRIC